MQSKDRLEQAMSQANRLGSTADGPNILQSNVTARLNQRDREAECGNSGFIMDNYDQYMKDYQSREKFESHFRNPGGMTFTKGSVLPEDK